MPEEEYRHCPACDKDDLPASAFGRDRSKSSGYASRCKPCDTTRSKRYYDAHREHKLAVARSKAVSIPDRECATCGMRYTPHRRDQRHCSMTCHEQRAHRGPTVTVSCAYCGKPVEKATRELARYPTSYCDRRCARRARLPGTALVGPVPRREVVGGPSVACADRPRPRKWIAGPCGECGLLFIARWARGQPSIYCTPTCAKRSARRRGKWARSKRIHEAGQRDRVSLAKVAKRDGWRCHICKRKVTRSTWSLDHLVPLSRGGDHTYANVALAHHHCNMLRGNRGHAQLRLAA